MQLSACVVDARTVPSLVVFHNTVDQAQEPLIEDPAAKREITLGECQVGDGHRNIGGNGEDTAGRFTMVWLRSRSLDDRQVLAAADELELLVDVHMATGDSDGYP